MTEKNEKRKISLERANELKKYANPFVKFKKEQNKIIVERNQKTKKVKERILKYFDATEEDWNNWKWQLKNRITNTEVLKQILPLSDKEIKEIEKVSKLYRWAISPYYLSLIDEENKHDPIKLLSIPSILELEVGGDIDPMSEEYTNPAGSITRRYPNRLIINVTNTCASYCRHCQRRRKIGEIDTVTNWECIEESINYIKNNEEITDVLITGGDPLTLTDNVLEKIISDIRAIPHVEIIRIGTRTLVTMPQRITKELVDMLNKYQPIYINTHFNHPFEITEESSRACQMLAGGGGSIRQSNGFIKQC